MTDWQARQFRWLSALVSFVWLLYLLGKFHNKHNFLLKQIKLLNTNFQISNYYSLSKHNHPHNSHHPDPHPLHSGDLHNQPQLVKQG